MPSCSPNSIVTGKPHPNLFEELNLRLAQSVTARNALGRNKDDNAREIATMLYGEIRPGGHFRFVNFGHPPPLVFSAEYEKFMEIDKAQMVQFLALGLEIPEDHPDRNKYLSMALRTRQINSSDVAEITLMSPGDMLFLYTDGVYDGSDEQERAQIEAVIREHAGNRPERFVMRSWNMLSSRIRTCNRAAKLTASTTRPCSSSSGTSVP